MEEEQVSLDTKSLLQHQPELIQQYRKQAVVVSTFIKISSKLITLQEAIWNPVQPCMGFSILI